MSQRDFQITPVGEVLSDAADEQDLSQFGYQQRLRRTITTFTSFCLAFSMIAITGTLGPLLGPSLAQVGGVATWFWPLAFAGVIWIVLVFMHMAARIPVTGYAYQWASRLVSPYYGWIVAVIGLITFTTGGTSIAALLGSIMAPELGLSGTTTQIIVIAVAALTFCFMLNIVGIRIATHFNNGVAINEIVVTVLFTLALLVGLVFFFDKSVGVSAITMHGVDGHSGTKIPWENYVFAATAPIFSLMGWEASADLAEETVDPRRAAPRAMFRAVCICALGGFLVMGIIIASIHTSIADAVTHPNTMFWIVEERFGGFVAAIVKVTAFLSLLGCIVANIAVATRLLYSVSRDRLMPFSEQLGSISRRFRTPVVASITLWAICMIINIAGGGQIFRITAMAVIAYYLTYVATMVAVMIGHRRKTIPDAPAGAFNLRHWLMPVSTVALLWSVGVIVAYLSPAANHYIIGYFAAALGLGALLTIYAWSGLKSGRASVPDTAAKLVHSGTGVD